MDAFLRRDVLFSTQTHFPLLSTSPISPSFFSPLNVHPWEPWLMCSGWVSPALLVALLRAKAKRDSWMGSEAGGVLSPGKDFCSNSQSSLFIQTLSASKNPNPQIVYTKTHTNKHTHRQIQHHSIHYTLVERQASQQTYSCVGIHTYKHTRTHLHSCPSVFFRG